MAETAVRMVVERVPVQDVFVTGERRPAHPDAVATLAESIKRIGLHTPITVRVDDTIPDPETGKTMGGYAIVTGRHRLEAYRLLGLDYIPAIIRNCDEIEAELWEIAENLHRVDLTTEERYRYINRYDALLKRQAEEAKKKEGAGEGVSRQSGGKLSVRGRHGEGRPAGNADKIVAATGLSKRTVERALAKAKTDGNKPPSKPKPELTREKWLADFWKLWKKGEPEWHDEVRQEI